MRAVLGALAAAAGTVVLVVAVWGGGEWLRLDMEAEMTRNVEDHRETGR